MSKGSRQRPFDYKKFNDNYDKIFGEKHKELSKKALEDAMVDLSKNPKKYVRKTYSMRRVYA